MGAKEVFECICDRCKKLSRVLKKNSHGWFENPKGWHQWDDRAGTTVLLCQQCDQETRKFFGIEKTTVKEEE